MIFDGERYVISHTYGWRQAVPGDTCADGLPVPSGYVVIVRIKDCPIKEEDGRRYYYPSGVASAFQGYYGGSNVIFTPYERKVPPNQVWIGRELVTEFWSCRVFLVRKGKVYTRTHRMTRPPEWSRRAEKHRPPD